jgi:anti-sigma-K factor RskA
MSGGHDTTGDGEFDRDDLAAEYVLGLMDAADRAAFAARLEADPDLAEAVAAWGARLEPLTAEVDRVAPSDTLWPRIRRDLALGQPAAARTADVPARIPPRGAGPWRALAVGGFGVAACLGAALLLSGHHLDVTIAWDKPSGRAPALVAMAPPPPVAPLPPAKPELPPAAKPAAAPPAPPPVVKLAAKEPPPPTPPTPQSGVALLTAAGSEVPSMKAFISPDGSVKLAAIQTVAVPPGKALGFWVWPHGVARPILIGRVQADGGTLRFPYHEPDGTPVMVTLEPSDLPYTGEQGPTLFQGQIVLLN